MPRLLVPLVLLLVVPCTAWSQETQAIGSNTAGRFSRTLDCGGDKVIIGLEIKYGQVGIGKIRAVCRKVSSSGTWAGGAGLTPWTQVDTEAESTYTKSTHCGQNQAVAAFQGRVQGAYIHALRLGCRSLAEDGGAVGGLSWKSFVGVDNGASSGSIECVSGTAARAIRTRSRSNLHRFSLVCHRADVIPPATRRHTLTGVEVGRLFLRATQAGHRSSCRLLDPPTQPDVTCHITNNNQRPKIEARYTNLVVGPSSAWAANIVLFQGARLPSGWSLRSIELEGNPSYPVCPEPQRTAPLRADSLETRLRIGCSMAGSYTITRVVLEGPDGTEWRNHLFP